MCWQNQITWPLIKIRRKKNKEQHNNHWQTHEKALNPRSQRSELTINIIPTKTNWHNPKERIMQEKKSIAQSKQSKVERRRKR